MFRRFLPVLALTAFALIPISPLVSGRTLCSDDGRPQIYKAVELEALIRAGHWFPRWSPDMAHGFGYPLFNFYAPLTAYLLVAIHSLGFIYPVALHMLFGFTIWLCGLGMFAFVRRWWGEAAGLLAAVVYITAPYLGYDILFRGALAETFAWALLPFILWALDKSLITNLQSPTYVAPAPSRAPRARGRGRRRSYGISNLQSPFPNYPFPITDPQAALWFAFSASLYAALILTHNLSALILSPLIVAYVALIAWERKDAQALITGYCSLLTGLLLSAFFWLPAMVERQYVQFEVLFEPFEFNYANNFISLGELLAPPQVVDPLLLNPAPPRSLGLVTAILAGLGIATLLRNSQFAIHPSPFAIRVLFFAAALSLSGLMTLQISQPIWKAIPLLPFVQFPWRFLLPAAFCASVLAGAVVQFASRNSQFATRNSQLATRNSQPLIPNPSLFLTATLILVANLSWWYPLYCEPMQEETIARMIDAEYRSSTIGTSARGEFLPRTVIKFPDDRSVADDLIAGQLPQRLANLPEGATVEYVSTDPLALEFIVTSPKSFDLTYRQFHFPGWSAAVNSASTPVQPTPESGWISLSIPAGTHAVRIYFGATPLRTTTSAISALAALLLILLAFTAFVRRRPQLETSNLPPATGPLRPASRFLLLVSCILPLALLALKLAVIDRIPNPLRHSAYDGSTLHGLGTPLDLPLAGGLDLLAYEVRPSRVPSGGVFDPVLYLAVREPIPTNYHPNFSVQDSSGITWDVPGDMLTPRWDRGPYPTNYWPAGKYARVSRHETLLPGAPPGRYRLVGSIFDILDPERTPDSLLGPQGNPVARSFSLGEIVVTRPSRPAAPAELQMQFTSNSALGHGLNLLGYNADRTESQPGDSLLITLFWHADSKPDADFSAELSLLDTTGQRIFSASVPPASDQFPTSHWRTGDVWRGQHLIRLPADLPSGSYQWTLGLSPGASSVPLTRLTLTAPTRSFDAPTFDHPAGARFGDFAELVGYTLSPFTDYQLPITLYWHSLTTPTSSYSAFVHLSDSSGRIWAQSDAVSDNWTRPTTGWLPGEYVTDARALSLPAEMPPGEYTLFVGLADLQTGERLPASGPGAQGDGRAEIGVISLMP